MAILNNNPLVGASGNQGGYNINNSLRFRSSASAFLNRTPASAGNRRTWTWSAWVKTSLDCSFMYAKNGNYGTKIYFNDNKFGIFDWQAAVAIYWEVASSAVFRDPSAWYHLVVAVDTTQATASNRVKLYVNGNQITALATSNYPTQNYDGIMNTANPTFIGKQSTTIYGEQSFFDGYMADVNFIDGSAKTPSDFGETDTTTGVWKPKAYTGTYGTNGFYLKFSDIATTSGSNAGLGKDFSGNSNYWTTNNISVTSGTTYDAMTDSPTLTSATVANYCVLNPLNKGTGTLTVTDGNLQSAITTFTVFGSMAVSSGKWYWEVTIGTNGAYLTPGIAAITVQNNVYLYNQNPAVSYYGFDGSKYVNGTNSSYGATFTNGDVIGIAFDADNNQITFYKNNTSQGTITGLTSGQTWTPAISTGDNSASRSSSANFGQRPFTYTPPTGFVALNTFNLPTSTIVKGNTNFDVVTRNGGGSSGGTYSTTLDLSQGGFLWDKPRNSVNSHYLIDSVRGISKTINSNTTNAEATDTNWFTSFNNGSYTTGSTDWGTTTTIVEWIWKAGGTGVSNTSGSITSTVSANTTAGFSIVTYTGTGANATVGHGLGVAPKMVIVKRRNSTGDWLVWNSVIAASNAANVLFLNDTAAQSALSTNFNSTAPTSTVFSVGTNPATNASGGTHVAYCWAEIAGFSRFDSYTGNGSTDGTFVYTGFRPKYVLIKRTDTANNWYAKDTSRDPVNAAGNTILVDLLDAEYGPANTLIDILSNGFKSRTTSAGVNASSGTYIYMAFAENPFKNSLAR